MSAENLPYLTSVLRALATMSRFGDEEKQALDLLHAGESTESCDDLIAFSQSAAARVVIGDRLLFSPTYYRCNYRTRKAVERRYDQTPMYTAAVQAFGLLNTADLAAEEVHELAYCSAEFKILMTAVEKKIPAGKARISAMFHPTDGPVEGLDLDALMNAQKLPGPAPSLPSTGITGLKKEKRWWQLW